MVDVATAAVERRCSAPRRKLPADPDALLRCSATGSLFVTADTSRGGDDGRGARASPRASPGPPAHRGPGACNAGDRRHLRVSGSDADAAARWVRWSGRLPRPSRRSRRWTSRRCSRPQAMHASRSSGDRPDSVRRWRAPSTRRAPGGRDPRCWLCRRMFSRSQAVTSRRYSSRDSPHGGCALMERLLGSAGRGAERCRAGGGSCGTRRQGRHPCLSPSERLPTCWWFGLTDRYVDNDHPVLRGRTRHQRQPGSLSPRQERRPAPGGRNPHRRGHQPGAIHC